MNSPQQSVTVLGLGSMGIALGRALLQAGTPTTVWNRTPGRAEPIAAAGATAASSLDEAVSSSELIVVCLRDHAAVREVLGGLDPESFVGRRIVNLSSATPQEARDTAHWAADRGIAYLNGAIMVPTPMIGTAEAVMLYSGDSDVFEKSRDQLRQIAGVGDLLGDDPGKAALFDVAMLEIFFTSMTSFLHASALMTANGITASEFVPYAEQMAALGGSEYRSLAASVDADDHDGTEDNLAMELAALDHITRTSADFGLDGGLADHLQDLARRSVAAGHGADSYSRIVDEIRAGGA